MYFITGISTNAIFVTKYRLVYLLWGNIERYPEWNKNKIWNFRSDIYLNTNPNICRKMSFFSCEIFQSDLSKPVATSLANGTGSLNWQISPTFIFITQCNSVFKAVLNYYFEPPVSGKLLALKYFFPRWFAICNYVKCSSVSTSKFFRDFGLPIKFCSSPTPLFPCTLYT